MAAFPNLPTFPRPTSPLVPPTSPQPQSMSPTISEPDAVENTVENTSTSVSALLAERGTRYGEFISHARITQAFKLTSADYLRRSANVLAADQQEALDMIFHKIGRIINGDPNYADSWIDIAGYAKLVSDRLESQQKGDSALKQ